MSQMAALIVLRRVLRMFLEPNPSIMLQKKDCSMRPAAALTLYIGQNSRLSALTRAPRTHLPDRMDKSSLPLWSILALLLLHSNVLTLLQTVCCVCNSSYFLKQFSASRMGSVRLESQNTFCPLIISLSLPLHPLIVFSPFSN